MSEPQIAEKRAEVLALLDSVTKISDEQRAEMRRGLKVDDDRKVERIDVETLAAQAERLNQIGDGESWLFPLRLVSFASDTVRIEIGPQIVDLPCTDENLSDAVTHRGYRVGGQDARGRMIRPREAGIPEGAIKAHERKVGKSIEAGEPMAVVDYRAKLVPHLWKVYQLQETNDPNLNGYDENGEPNVVERFIKVNECEGFDDALAAARELVEGE